MTWRIVPWSLIGLVVGGCSLLFDASDGDVGDASIQSALLSGLEVSSGVALDRPFEPSRFGYTANTTELMQPISITATAESPNASIVINNTSVESGIASPAIPLASGSNEIKIDVSDGTGIGQYSLTIDNHNSAQTAYVKASNTGAGDQFGISVSLSGDTLVVGAPFEDSAATGEGNSLENSGAVYVFRRTGSTWAEEAYIKASNTGAGDNFGFSVSVFGDTLAVGARHESSIATGIDGAQGNNSALSSGAVYVFRRNGTTWAQEAYIKASDTKEDDNFGQGVALGEDRLVVGAPGKEEAQTESGAAYVFHRSSEVWSQNALLKASNAGTGDSFGKVVAIAGDTLAVGASGEDSNAHGIGGNENNNNAVDSGAVYVFRYINNAWTQQAYMKGSDTEEKDLFGASVALSNDTLAVGAPGRLSDPTVGSAYVFHQVGDTWSQQQRLQATGSNNGDKFGSAITLVQDVLVVGASEREGGSGAAYVFRRIGEQWSERQFLRGSNADTDDDFGLCMALSDDTLVVCARLEDGSAVGVGGDVDEATSNSGAVYLFR